jgi:hypothetical protein
MVLEQERERHTGYSPLDDFRHVRDAVSHPELGSPSARAFLLANISSEQVDLRNPTHVAFLEKQCNMLLDESRQVVEGHLSRFWR